MTRTLFAPLRIAAALVLSAAVFPAAAGADAVTRGRGLVERDCASCHAIVPGKASPNAAAPPFAQVAGEPSATAYALHVFLRSTHATMPNFIMSSEEIDDIVAYIRSLRAKP